MEQSKKVSRSTYAGVHVWLRDKFGKAIACESPKCEGKSREFQYALRAGKTHKKLRANYMTLCAPCHREYDTKNKNKGHIIEPRLSMKLLWKLNTEYRADVDYATTEKLNGFLNFVEKRMKSPQGIK